MPPPPGRFLARLPTAAVHFVLSPAGLLDAWARRTARGVAGANEHRADPNQFAMCAEGHRTICQDTGIVVVFVKVGMKCGGTA